MVATRLGKGSKHKVPERRSSSRIQELIIHAAPDTFVAAVAETVPATAPVELTDAEIETTLCHADALDTDVKRALIALRRETLRVATRPPVAFALPFTPEEIKSIGHRKVARHPPPFGRINKSIYLSKTVPVADLPVHKCNCFEDTTAASSSARRKLLAAEPVLAPRKKRGKKPICVEPPAEPKSYCGDGCHNRILFISCSPDTCSAADPALCSNRAIKRRETKPVRVEYVAGPGFGLFTDVAIAPNEFVIEYVGEVIDDRECERRLLRDRDQGESHFYMLEIEKDVVIDARYRSNDARFINHSCDPNCMTQKWNVDGVRRIGIFARRRLLAGEEITIDYNFSHFGVPMDCKCGSVACTGKLGLKRSDVVMTKHSLQRLHASTKNGQGEVDASPPELKRPVQLSSLALLKAAKLDVRWLNFYGFKKRRLFADRDTGTVGLHKQLDATALASLTSHSTTTTTTTINSSHSSPLSSEWSGTTAEDVTDAASSQPTLPTRPTRPRTSDWYNRVQRGDHLVEMRAMTSYICGGKADWTDDLLDVVAPKSRPSQTTRSMTKRVGLLDARARRFEDLLAFANGTSAWNTRVASSARIDPDRIYRFIDAMKNGHVFHNQNQNDLNEDACHRCGLAGELICCDGCPAAFHLNCTNLMMLPPQGEPWFCAECKRTARQRAQVEAQIAAATDATTTETETEALGARRNLRGLSTTTAKTAPIMPSLKRIFHATSTKTSGGSKRRPRKKMKTSDKAYRLLENLPLPAFDWEEDDE